MSNLNLITAALVIEYNRMICAEGGNQHQCSDTGKVESALHSAFYPGVYPYRNGGVARLGGAACYFLTMAHAFFDGNKRTAVVSSIAFLRMNGFNLQSPTDSKTGFTILGTLVNNCASGIVSKDEMMNWYEQHRAIL